MPNRSIAAEGCRRRQRWKTLRYQRWHSPRFPVLAEVREGLSNTPTGPVPQNGFGILEDFSQLLSGSTSPMYPGICSSSFTSTDFRSPVRFRRTRWQREHRSGSGYRKWSAADVFASSTRGRASCTGIYRHCGLSGNEGVGDTAADNQLVSGADRESERSVGRYFRTTNDSHHRTSRFFFSALRHQFSQQRACAHQHQNLPIPWVEACARCAVPKASITNTSQGGVFLDNFVVFLFAFVKAKTFSRTTSSPSATSTPSVIFDGRTGLSSLSFR